MKTNYRIQILAILFTLLSIGAKSQCAANFTYTVNAGGNVSFTNLSTASSSLVNYYWNFGDSNTMWTINTSSVSNTYAANGTYTVSLMVTDSTSSPTCYNTFTQTLTIANSVCLLNAGFSTNMGINGQVVFNNTTTGTGPSTSYSISYGDGNTGMSIANHTYSVTGTYTVLLMAANSATCSSTYSAVLNVSVFPCPFNAGFTYTVNNGTVNFSNTSTGSSTNTTLYYWDFGNGNTEYTTLNSPNPSTQTYPGNGQYLVSLTMKDSLNTFCSNTYTQNITLSSAPCIVNSSFNMVKDTTAMSSVVWSAYPNYPTNLTSVLWNWGDGSTDNTLYPSHTFSATGYYNICLTVSVACGSSSTTCLNSNIFRMSSYMQIATVNVINAAITNTVSTGIATVNPLAKTLIFPNPASDFLNIANAPADYKIVISDMLGNTVYVKEHNTADSRIELQDYKAGIYLIQMSGDGFLKTTKLIKQ